MTDPLTTPVAFIIFNRPKCTRRVFERIREARPEKLYLIADAPRAHKPGEVEKCAETRRIVEDMIDWPCEVHKNYAEQNMGCGKRIPSGLDWVFEHEECAIILEDDILVDPTFFTFCSQMLERYKDNEMVIQVSGYNQLNYTPPGNSDYFYSRYGDIWGWATWRRSWIFFREFDRDAWIKIKHDNLFNSKLPSKEEARLCTFVLDEIFSGKLNTWAMRWHLTRTMKEMWSITPARNLARNIGFGPSASHTINPVNRHQTVRIETLLPPYTPPDEFARDPVFEALYEKAVFKRNIATERIRNTLLHMLRRTLRALS